MININNVVLVGRLTKEIELRKTNQNRSYCSFTLAVNRRYKQDSQQEADFIQVIAWGQSADFLSDYAHKGYEISVEGRIQTRNYDGPSGKVYVTEVVATQVMLGAAPSNAKAQETSKPSEQVYPDYEPNPDISEDDLPFY